MEVVEVEAVVAAEQEPSVLEPAEDPSGFQISAPFMVNHTYNSTVGANVLDDDDSITFSP